MKSQEAQNAKALWREFECLAVQIVSEAFGIKPQIVYVTHQSKDGGYDGVITHSLSEGLLGPIDNKTYVEAKLRSGEKGIGLRDFAATLVIAINEAAQTLVVVANRPFTGQAITHACSLFVRTNLRVILVNGAMVSGWVRRNRANLEPHYSAALLEELIIDDPDQEKYTEHRFDFLPRYRHRRQESNNLSGFILRTGWHDDGTLTDCELRLEHNGLPPKAELLALIGKRRRTLVDDLKASLGGRNGEGTIVALTGTGGVGKSVIVEHVLDGLACPTDKGNLAWTGLVDVGQASSSRALFISILTALFGIDPRELTNGEDEYWEPEVLVARLGGEHTTAAMREAVLRTLRRDLQEYESSWDLSAEPLLAFLRQVVSNRCKVQAITLVFQELNRGTTETLDFLYQASRALKDAGVSVLLEIRDQGYEQTAYKRTLDGQITVLTVSEWDATVKRLCGLAGGGVYRVDALSKEEAQDYLEELVPGLGPQRSSVIVSHVGTVPLHLRLTADWHKNEGILCRPEGGIYLVEDLDRFFSEQGITPSSVDIIFDRVIGSWWTHIDPGYRSCIAAAALLQGRLPITALELLVGESAAVEFIERLIASGLFTLAKDNRLDVEVAHDIIRERMAVFKVGASPVHAQVAKRLIPHVERFYPDKLTFKLRLVDLLEALGSSTATETYHHAHTAASAMAETRDWSTASLYFEKACRALGGCTGSPLSPRQQMAELRTLADWLDVEVLRYRIGRPENLNRLSALLALLYFPGAADRNSVEYQGLKIRAKMLEWRYHYVHEDFDKALEAAKQAYSMALSCDPAVDVEVRGKALSNYAVALKVKDQRDNSFEVFEKALEILPESYTVRAERLSNIAAFALRDDPDKALECYRELLRITHGTAYSFSEIIHAHVDIAMAQFLKHNLKAAERDSQSAIMLAVNNGVPAEEARGRNILGCTLWAKGLVQEADQMFEQAAFASERTISNRFLWRMRTNCAGTALELGDLARAYSLANSAEQAILTPREKNFPNLVNDQTYMTSRWYAALIAIGSYYHAMGKRDCFARLYQRVTLPLFRGHVEGFIKESPPPEVFSKTTFLHSQRIMITG